MLLSLILIGCQQASIKTITCTKELKEVGKSIIKNVIIIYRENDKIKKVESESVTEVTTMIDNVLDYSKKIAEKYNSVNGVEMKYEKLGSDKIKATTTINYDEIDINDIKAKLGDALSENVFMLIKI